MISSLHLRNSTLISRAAATILTILFVLALILLFAQSAQAQTFTLIHNFTGGGDGAQPQTGLTKDAAGNFYGTGGNTVFKLKRSGSSWVLNTLYTFQGGIYGRVAIAPDGTLYGTTMYGGTGSGTVFHLVPLPTAPKTAVAPWSETDLYLFTGGSDGKYPESDIIFDQSGNIYGNTYMGGDSQACDDGCGVVYKLSRSGGGWTQSVLYTFHSSDGLSPWSGVIFDKAGNLYGSALEGGQYYAGEVYQLSPSGSGWTMHVLYTFTGGADGRHPNGGLIFDPFGNLYGGCELGGIPSNAGTVFELTPSNGSWTFSTLYSFPECAYPNNYCGGPAGMTMDAAGNLYGATYLDGAYGYGNIFKLTHSGGGWIYTSLHDFTGHADGGYPNSPVVLDASGNLYGTAWVGGSYGEGVIWEITP